MIVLILLDLLGAVIDGSLTSGCTKDALDVSSELLENVSRTPTKEFVDNMVTSPDRIFKGPSCSKIEGTMEKIVKLGECVSVEVVVKDGKEVIECLASDLSAQHADLIDQGDGDDLCVGESPEAEDEVRQARIVLKAIRGEVNRKLEDYIAGGR